MTPGQTVCVCGWGGRAWSRGGGKSWPLSYLLGLAFGGLKQGLVRKLFLKQANIFSFVGHKVSITTIQLCRFEDSSHRLPERMDMVGFGTLDVEYPPLLKHYLSGNCLQTPQVVFEDTGIHSTLPAI